jgi:hypothetical protein
LNTVHGYASATTTGTKNAAERLAGLLAAVEAQVAAEAARRGPTPEQMCALLRAVKALLHELDMAAIPARPATALGPWRIDRQTEPGQVG